MKYIIVVFNSRFSTLNFSNFLKDNNIPCAIINTPQNIQRACGISVKFLADYFSKVKELIERKGGLRNFDGFYAVSQEGGQQQYYRI